MKSAFSTHKSTVFKVIIMINSGGIMEGRQQLPIKEE
jgi:hypothetical protein